MSDSGLIVIIGKFNLLALSNNKNLLYLSLSIYHDFTAAKFDMSLGKINHIRNSIGRLLDLCFVSDPDRITFSRALPLF